MTRRHQQDIANDADHLDRTGGRHRARWAAIGAAVAVALGAGSGIGLVGAGSGEAGSSYTAITPCRLFDTRPAFQVGDRGSPFGAGEDDTFAARGAQGQCSAEQLPDDATALALNVTSVGAATNTFVTIWPDGERPNSSSLNPAPGQPPAPNAVITQLSSDGSFNVFNNRGSVDLFADVVGYFVETDANFVTQAELIQESNNVIDLLLDGNGPVKVNTRDIQANENHIERQQVLQVNRFDFHPLRASSDRDVARGAFIPSGSANNQLVATVDIPTGAIVTGIRAQLVDDTGGSSLKVDLFQISPSGFRQTVAATITTLGASNSSSPREFEAIASFRNSLDDKVTYEIVATIDQGVSWPTVNDDLQVVGFFIDYEMEVVPVL